MFRFLTFLGHQKRIIILVMAISLSCWMMSLQEQDKLYVAHAISSTLLQVGQRGFSWSVHLWHLKQENEKLRALLKKKKKI